MELRQYKRADYDGLVKLGQAAARTPGWKEYYPDLEKVENVAREFLLNDGLELRTDEVAKPLLYVAVEGDIVQGAIVAQTLDSFAASQVPQSENKFRELGWLDGGSYYQRHIAAMPECTDKFLVLRLFRKLKSSAAEKGFSRLVVGVPPKNERGLELMKLLRYGEEVFREKDGTEQPGWYPLVYFSQNTN